jgi:hypothetical protein
MPSHISEMTIVAMLLIVLLRSGGVAWTSGPDAEGDRDAVSSTPRGRWCRRRDLCKKKCVLCPVDEAAHYHRVPRQYTFFGCGGTTLLERDGAWSLSLSLARIKSLCRSPQGIIGVGYLSLPC